jgi:hypothetical protein
VTQGVIERLREASADYCLKLQADEMSERPATEVRIAPSARSASSSKRKKRPYSERDDNVFHRITEENFQILTNTELAKRFRGVLRERLAKPSPEAVRACLNRIRKQHALRTSKEIQKKRANASAVPVIARSGFAQTPMILEEFNDRSAV